MSNNYEEYAEALADRFIIQIEEVLDYYFHQKYIEQVDGINCSEDESNDDDNERIAEASIYFTRLYRCSQDKSCDITAASHVLAMSHVTAISTAIGTAIGAAIGNANGGWQVRCFGLVYIAPIVPVGNTVSFYPKRHYFTNQL